MRSVSIHLPQAQVPVPVLLGQLIPAAKYRSIDSAQREFTYLCFHLCDHSVSAGLEKRLTALGIECISQGEDYTAYGIAPKDEDLLKLIASDREIVTVEIHEPSSGK